MRGKRGVAAVVGLVAIAAASVERGGAVGSDDPGRSFDLQGGTAIGGACVVAVVGGGVGVAAGVKVSVPMSDGS